MKKKDEEVASTAVEAGDLRTDSQSTQQVELVSDQGQVGTQ